MKIVLAAAASLALCACDMAPPPAPEARKVEYRPEEAGTVDHALCLLGFTAIPLREARSTGHHLVTASVNGKEGVFVLDTGANLSVIDVDHAAYFGLRTARGRPGGATGLGGSNVARQVSIDSLALGGVRVRQRRMVVTDLGSIGDALAPLSGGAVHGIIGQDALKEHRAVIDVERPLLYLIEADEAPAPVPAERCRRSASPSLEGSG
ncbi:MAG TPA: retropepsin-like aspartic protease [Allosphingosinicella sp.]|nr:retropepsin-like aspartic protease [Allosphingosinicella sp.]